MTPYPLSRSDRNTKILVTLFLATMAVSIFVAELNVRDKVRFTGAGVVARYGPDEETPAAPSPSGAGPTSGAASSGTAEEFPLETGANAANSESTRAVTSDETAVARMNTFTLLLDVTHPHVFELPLVVFVLAHFLMRTRAPEWLKLTTYVGGFGGIAAFLGTPWLVRYVTIAAAPLMLVGALAIGLTSFVMIVVPIVDMWTPPSTKKRTVRAPAPEGAGE